jgi:hypothetical protein
MSIRLRARAQTVCKLGLGAVVVLVACLAEDEPTGVSGPPSNVVRGAGCTPEVIQTSSGSSDTLLITFENPSNPLQLCINLAPYGIDMVDPMPVDTPQGDGLFMPRTDHAANLPSGIVYALGAQYTPPQVMIEFDPPISSAEFYYSRRLNSEAIWNGVMAPYDSMPVWAVSRTPGTLSYQFWASKTLYGNVPANTPDVVTNLDVWTPVKLQSNFGDKIQWLWFNGTIAIDNLKVVRTPLSCTSTVVRGQQQRCVFSSNAWTVTRWEFTPDGDGGMTALRREPGSEGLSLASVSSPPMPVVVENTSNKEWTGGVAVGGSVKVYVTNGTTSRTYETHFAVTDRPYNWRATWDYRQGPDSTVADLDLDPADTVYGRNCPQQFPKESTCIAQTRLRIQPDPWVQPGAGYSMNSFPTGPNTGYWYVASISYDMKRVGNVHQGMLFTSTRKHTVPTELFSKNCKKGLGLSPNASTGQANHYQINKFCTVATTPPIPIDNLISGLYGHEGFGYNGGVGHETLGQQAAGEPQNDPYKAIEKLTATDSVTLAGLIDPEVLIIGQEISLKAADKNSINGGPHGNFDPAQYPNTKIYFWNFNPTTQVWFISTNALLTKF